MKDEVPVSKRKRTPGEQEVCAFPKKRTDLCPAAGVRRPSGRAVILGLLVAALMLQGTLLVGFHGAEWTSEPKTIDLGEWGYLHLNQPGSSPNASFIPTNKPPVYYPPPEWGDELLAHRAEPNLDDARAIAYATPTFNVLLNFLKQQMPFTTTHGCEAAPKKLALNGNFVGHFRQASTAAP